MHRMQGLLGSVGFRDRPRRLCPSLYCEPCETMRSRLTRSHEEYSAHVQKMQEGVSARPCRRQFTPIAKDLILTHIFGKALGEGLDKAEVLPTSTMPVGLSSPFAKSICKMWVKDRAKDKGHSCRLRVDLFVNSTMPLSGSVRQVDQTP